MSQPGPTLTLRDIADLTGVQRAVVSMWRRRPTVRGQLMPFPDPVPQSETGAIERFRRDEVVAWLARTGRGNNTEHRLDAPALTVPPDAPLEDLVALLCLYPHLDGDLADLGPDELVRLAEQVDPADTYLLAEVRQVAADPAVPRFLDDLVEASHGLAEALTRLENGQAGRALGRRDLTTDATAIIASVVQTATLHLDPDGTTIAVTDSPASLLPAVAPSAARVVIDGTGPDDRALRRRAVLHDLPVADRAEPPLIQLRYLLGQGADQTLDTLDNLLLDLGPGEVAIALGPASVLCDRLRGRAERDRATTLRSGRLVAALRLPRGMWREAHRQALGLWLCSGDTTTNRPRVADLGGVPPTEVSLPDLSADLSAALADDHRRGFRYLRTADLPTILTGTAVVPPGARAPRWAGSPDGHLDRIRAASLVTAQPVTPFDVLVAGSGGRLVLRQRSLGELHDAGLLKVLRGARINPADADPAGTVAVLTADPTATPLMLDPVEAQHRYPRAQRTEPGDVIFVETPTPGAQVDQYGGSLVATPARILRLGPQTGLGRYIAAAIINHYSQSGEWRAWTVPILDVPGADALEATLADADRYLANLRHRRQAAHDLVVALIDGTAAGAVTVTPPGTTEEGPHRATT
ncbi:MAG: hypothetical protein HYR62_06040 [Actinobacteria bacterium]|nr:hypothetical protein [Actinomycetota bacterium]